MLIRSTDPPEFICSVCFIHAEERMLLKLPKKVTVLITDKNQWVAVESSDAFLFLVIRKYWIRTAELSVLNSYTDMTVLLYTHAIPRTGWQLTTGSAASLFLICWGLLCCCSLFSCGFSLLWPVLSVICSFIPQYCASALGMHSGCFPRWRVKLNRLAFMLGHLLVIRDAPMYLTVVEFCQVKALVSGSAADGWPWY